MIDLHFTFGINYGSSQAPVVEPVLKTVKAKPASTATAAAKSTKRYRPIQLKL